MKSNVSINPVNLSSREIEIVKYMSKEYTSKEIAAKLFISPRTVDRHRENIQRKVGALCTTGVIIYAVKNNLIE